MIAEVSQGDSDDSDSSSDSDSDSESSLSEGEYLSNNPWEVQFQSIVLSGRNWKIDLYPPRIFDNEKQIT